MSPRMLLLLLFAGLGYTGVSVHAWGTVAPVPSESECRPYIEKALKELSTEPTQEAVDTASSPDTPQTTDTSDEGSEQEGSIEGTEESVTTESAEKEDDKSREEDDGESNESKERKDQEESGETNEQDEKKDSEQGQNEETEVQDDEQSEEAESKADDSGEEEQGESAEGGDESTESQEAVEGEEKDESAEKEEELGEGSDEEDSTEGKKSDEGVASVEEQQNDESVEQADKESTEEGIKSAEDSTEEGVDKNESGQDASQEDEKGSEEDEDSTDKDELTTKDSQEEKSGEAETKSEESVESADKHDESTEADAASTEESGEAEEKTVDQSAEDTGSAEVSAEVEDKSKDQSVEEGASTEEDASAEETANAEESGETEDKSKEKSADESDEDGERDAKTDEKESVESEEATKEEESVEEKGDKSGEEKDSKEDSGEKSMQDTASEAEESDEDRTPEEDLTIDVVIPEKLRPREHIGQILKLDSESAETELLLSKTMDITLRELKRLYDTAIQPLEILYKYRDLSNRHFGDPEIFSKPLILFMGPWSGGKSTIINYLLNNEYAKSALRTGAEPSPAYFNILMYGEREEVLDGTQLAADWTFSGLQKFGQGLLDRLRGLKLKNPLLEKVNIVEIPGILEIRKQVERLFPFNDACQWFIDRADIIFLVYDPSKLDVGPETEAILDQLKGREYQTRIILNKADQVKPEELMRVQGTLIWNISPLMSSSEPPVMYSTSLWSIPYEIGSPTRLLYAQEKAFLKDLRDAIDKRVENKIASARRFAVRVRNHAKMVDCYLTTYYNHKSFFGNRKKVADDIIEHPQNYHIYEGLSTLTNISRYDLPDPEVYRDFFRLNQVYEFQQLSATCTYFRGCPINRLDVAIAYDLPELVGKYKKAAESVLTSAEVPPKS